MESIDEEIIKDGLTKHTTRRIDLSFIVEDDEEPFFYPRYTIESNVIKFIDEFTPYSIINTTDLFTSEACEKINKKYKLLGETNNTVIQI